ncbi:MAG TPA: AI-2E family transporter [Thermoanaerobaculia bacterium]|nr:AI-2E family transporter [Thermoanaerobaculia bacterium]
MNRTTALRLEKWAIWAALIGVVFLLRHLFPIFFLTFVLTYIANTAVNAMTGRWGRRRLNVVIVYVAFLAIITGVVLLVVPRMLNEARNLARQYIASEVAREGDGETLIHRESREFVDRVVAGVAGPDGVRDFRESDAYITIVGRLESALTSTSRRVATEVTAFANTALLFALHFILSMILSFLLIWDLPATKARLRKFSEGRSAEIYEEITPGVTAFGVMLGRAFEAQTVVAIVNAVLSTILFMLLGLPSIALLAVIVFVCSYIPVAGMVLSTLPAAFLALKTGGGSSVLWLVIGVLVIHAIEAYMLNPLIYGRHLRLHPVAVLLVLVIAEHLFGVWGLLLGVPIAAFVLKYVIEGQPVTPAPVPVPRESSR